MAFFGSTAAARWLEPRLGLVFGAQIFGAQASDLQDFKRRLCRLTRPKPSTRPHYQLEQIRITKPLI